MHRAFIILFVVFLSACASQRPKNDSNYEQDLIYPKEAFPFVLVDKTIFDEPMAGVMLRYVDENHPTDYISVYVYPIADVVWDDLDGTLEEEMKSVMAEVDYMVQMGKYASRDAQTEEKFSFTHAGREYIGRKAKFSFTHSDTNRYDSYAYLFISEDKFIKFRTSFDASETQNWSGDKIVTTLLPKIQVPKESDYMKALREEHRQQMANQLIKMLLESAAENKNTDSSD